MGKSKKISLPASRVSIINKRGTPGIINNSLSKKNKREIEMVVKKIVKEYGETLRLLGRE